MTPSRIDFEMKPTDLLKDVLEPLSFMMHVRKKLFELLVSCPNHLYVTTDALRLKQVVLNLVRNATKFVTKGLIRIRAEETAVNESVRIFIEDSGPCIPPEKQKTLFQKYQPNLDLLNQETEIGLYLSKTLMNSMNGELTYDSSYRSGLDASSPGTRFVIDLNSLRLSQAKMETLSIRGFQLEDSERDSVPLCSISERFDIATGLPTELSVLFVDDDAMLRKLFVRATRNVCSTWHIKEASCGEQAIELCRDHKFDLIFMDQYMASASKQLLGSETTGRLRSTGVQSLICGLSANDAEDEFRNHGADYFVLKPIPCKKTELRKLTFDILEHGEVSRLPS